jgi:heme exporter protein A
MTEKDNKPIIEIRQLVKTYGVLPVLRKLDLTINRGDFVALLGPNGSGKSTLLRLLTGISRPTAGRVLVGGWELPKEVAAVRAQIGLVSHLSLLYENLTAYENLQFFARLYNLPSGEMDDTIKAMLRQVGLYKRMHDLVRTFSRGMQQRLSIARALIHDPAILLFDEPYTGLDQDAAGILDEMFLDMQERTIIMATHQLDRAARLTSRVVILSRGKAGYDVPSETLDTIKLAADYAEITGVASAR